LFARFLKAMEYYLKILHVRVLEKVGELQGQGLRVAATTEGEEGLDGAPINVGGGHEG
jgi:hypothetical protein